MTKNNIEDLIKPKKNEIWFVKLPKATAVMKIEIIEITDFTVVLKEVPILECLSTSSTRYETSDIKFIEKTKK